MLLLQDHARRTSTYGEMISSDPHGAKSPPDGSCDPSQGQRDTKGLHQRKGRAFHQRHFDRPRPRRVFPSHHDVVP
jgi:hypothetical protein